MRDALQQSSSSGPDAFYSLCSQSHRSQHARGGAILTHTVPRSRPPATDPTGCVMTRPTWKTLHAGNSPSELRVDPKRGGAGVAAASAAVSDNCRIGYAEVER